MKTEEIENNEFIENETHAAEPKSSDVSGNDHKIENETPAAEPKASDVSGNDQIIVNVSSDPVDLSGIESAIEEVHYQNAEIITTLQSLAEKPTVTPTILYSVLIIGIVMFAFFSRK